jgi:hypothetical protein
MNRSSERLGVLSRHLSPHSPLALSPTTGQTSPGLKKSPVVMKPRYRLIGWETVPQGHASAIWDQNGSMDLVEGPKSVFVINQNVQELPRYIASPSQYLVVQFKDGRKENIPGPTSIFYNPSTHDTIHVEEGVIVETGMAIIVYEKNGNDIKRLVISGPARHILASNQWMHRFFWNVPDQKNPTIANKQLMEFKKVRTIPDQIYFNVENVRTLDDALISVNLMIFFCLKDIDLMFERTHDPVSEMINSITADIIDFGSQRSFEEFKKQSDKLNSTELFTNLITKANSMGYSINKVVFRGYNTNTKLHEMHNSAIEARTALKLKSETEEQSQTNEDFKLEKEAVRYEKHRELRQKEVEHESQVQKMKQISVLENQRLQFNENVLQKRNEQLLHEESRKFELEHSKKLADMKKEIELDVEKGKAEIKYEYYAKLNNDLKVDITQVILAENRAAEKVINVNSKSDGVKVHVHE